MSYRKTNPFRPATPVATLLMAAAAFQCAPALGAEPLDQSSRSVAGGGALGEAASLAEQGRLIAAREAVHRYVEGRGERLSNAEAARACTLLASLSRRIESADPVEMSLQKAELALSRGDLAAADLHAGAADADARATPAQTARAAELRAEASRRRADMAPLVPGMLSGARADFEAGRYAQAKSALGAVRRSGVSLGEEESALLDVYQMRIVALERAQGSAFDAPAALGVVQPGAVPERTEEQPAEEQPAEQPGGQPAPAPAPGQEDLISQALRFEAQGLLSEAERLYADRQWNEAQARYTRLQEARYAQFLTPDQRAQVQSRLTEIRVRMGGQGGTLEDLRRQRELEHGRTVAAYNNAMDLATRSLSQGDTLTARNAVAQAILELNTGRGVLSDAEYTDYMRRARDAQANIDREEARIAERRRTETEAAIARQQAQSAEEARRLRNREINELLDKARAYQAELRYDDARATVDQILFLDPNNPAGLLLKTLYDDIIRFRRYGQMRGDAARGFQGLRLENADAAVPISDLVTFPPDWPSKTIQRGGPEAFADTAANRDVLRQIATTRVPVVDFRDNSLQDVVGFIRDIGHLDVDAQWERLSTVGVQPESTVTLNLKNASIETILNRVVKQVSGEDEPAAWGVVDGILTITSDEAMRKETALHIYDIRDLLIEVPDYDRVPAIDLQSVLQSGQGGGGQSPFRDDQSQNQQEDRRTLDERTEDIVNIITKIVDTEGWEDNGGSTGRIMKLAGSLIIINTPANHREISGLLGRLRQVRSMQINVETRFLLVNQDFFEQVGFDLDLYLNANNNQVRFARGRVPTTNVRDFFDNGQPVRRFGSPALGPTTGALPNLNQGVINPSDAGWSPIGFQQDSLGLASTIAPRGDWSDAILGGAPALGIAGSFLDDIQVDFLLRATQADRRSVQLTAPRLTFTNGQTSNIYVATQQAFVSDLEPVVGDSAVGFDPQVDVVTEGVTLLVEGTISADRRYVTMNVDAGIARIDGFANQAVTAVAGGQLVNSADTQSFIQLPTVTVTRVRTTATVPDQGTVLLGGQRLVTEYEVETGVPVLSKIPIINRLFSNRIESKEEQTLLILIKPTVLIQSEQEDRNFPGLANDLSAGLGG